MKMKSITVGLLVLVSVLLTPMAFATDVSTIQHQVLQVDSSVEDGSHQMESGFVREADDAIRYYQSDGSYAVGVTKIDGKTYYFDKNGELTFGWVKINGKQKYFSMTGTMGQAIKVSTVKGDYKKGSAYGSKLTSSELKKVKESVKKFLTTYIADNMTQYEKVCMAHDYLCNLCSYSESNNYSKTKSNTAYGALVKKKAQCSGYARAFKALCDAMGIKCYHVHADSKSINPSHQWNIVKVDGGYYHIDVQCNDSSGFYAVFLVSDAQQKAMGLSWKKSSYPKCPKNYFED